MGHLWHVALLHFSSLCGRLPRNHYANALFMLSMPQLGIPGLSAKPVGGPGVNGPDSGVNSASSGATGKGCGSGTGDSKVGWLACWSRELAAAGVVAAAA